MSTAALCRCTVSLLGPALQLSTLEPVQLMLLCTVNFNACFLDSNTIEIGDHTLLGAPLWLPCWLK